MRTSSVPSAFITYVPLLLAIAIFVPSGDQTGGPAIPTGTPARYGGLGGSNRPLGATKTIPPSRMKAIL